MKCISKFALCGCVVGALALSICAHQSPAQAARKAPPSGMHVDPALAKRGATLWNRRGCYVCHTVGNGKLSGPDLAGVTDRRSHEWLEKWLKDPTQMFGADPVADAMLEQYRFAKMPNMHLNDSDVEALINYLGQYH